MRRATVGDAAAAIQRAVGEALERSGAVITTGGLGPTSDDLTKQSIAELFGRGMELDEEHFRWMEERWRTRFNRPLPAANKQQAMMPEGATKLENRHGSAPGVWLEDERGRWVAMLPGVPREMRGMLADSLLPRLAARVTSGTVVRSRTLRTTGISESLLADKIDSMDGGPLGASSSRTCRPSPASTSVSPSATRRNATQSTPSSARRLACASARARGSTGKTTTTSRPSRSRCAARAVSRSASRRAVRAGCSAPGSRRFRGRATSCSAASSPTTTT